MDISSCSDKSECQDVSIVGGLQSSFKDNHCFDSFDCDLVNELENSLARTLYVNEVEQVEEDFANGDDVCDVKEGDESQLHQVEKGKYSHKLLDKSSSFPCRDREHVEPGTPRKGGLVSEDPSRNAYTRSISLPVSVFLVNALGRMCLNFSILFHFRVCS